MTQNMQRSTPNGVRKGDKYLSNNKNQEFGIFRTDHMTLFGCQGETR